MFKFYAAFLFFGVFLVKSSEAAWPPRNPQISLEEACSQFLFWSYVESEAGGRSLASRLGILENGGDPVEYATLRLLLASQTSHEGSTPPTELVQARQLLDLIESGIPPELAIFGAGPSACRLGEAVAIGEQGQVRYKGQDFLSLAMSYDWLLQSTYFHSAQGLVPEKSKLFAPTFPGVGAELSHAGSVLSLLNMFVSESTRKVLGQLKKDPNYIPVAAFTFDLPNNGTAFKSPLFTDFDINLEWLKTGLLKAMMARPHIIGSTRPPMVPVLRSAAPAIFAALNKAVPQLLQGMIWTSPMHPQDLEVSDKTIRALAARGKPGDYVLNEPGLQWVNTLFRDPKMDWHLQADPFNGLPVLILVGAEDIEEKQAIGERVGWKTFREWEQRFPKNVRFIIVEGAEHDLFNTRKKDILLKVMGYVYPVFQIHTGR